MCVCVCAVVWNSCHIVCGKGERTLKMPRPSVLRSSYSFEALLLSLLCLAIIRRHAHYNMYHNGKGPLYNPCQKFAFLLLTSFLFFCYLFHILCVLLTWAKDRRSSKQPSTPRVLITRISEVYVHSIFIFSLLHRLGAICCVCECVPTFVLKLSLRLWDIGLLFRLTFMQNVAAPPPFSSPSSTRYHCDNARL